MSQGSGKLLQLEGLRGVAALFVVLGHLKNMFWARMPEDAAAAVATVLPAPFPRLADILVRAMLPSAELCVWIFWVMSAYVLSVGFFRVREAAAGRIYMLAASAKRYFRLATPVLVVVLIAWAVLAAGWMRNHELAAVSGAAEAHWLRKSYNFAPDFLTALKSALWDTFFRYDEATTYNNALWTMEKELWGSFFIFAWMAVFGNWKWRHAAAALACVALAVFNLNWLNSFMAGMILCDLQMRGARLPVLQPEWDRSRRFLENSRAAAFMGMGGLLLAAGARFNEFRGLRDLFLSTAFVVMALISGPCRRSLSLQAPVFLGKISFGMYLIHIPILLSVVAGVFLSLRGWCPAAVAASLAALLGIVLSLACGWVVWATGDRGGIRLAQIIAKKVRPAGASQKNPRYT